MFTVYFYENKNVLLNQLRNKIPITGDDIVIKGRKGKVTDVSSDEDKRVHVQVTLETVLKNAAAMDLSKKKKR